MKTIVNRVDLKEESRAAVARSLNMFLADEHILYMKTRNAHWNVTGADFHPMHLFFEEQYRQLEEIIDNIAERIRMVGQYPQATFQHFLKITRLIEQRESDNTSLNFIQTLLSDHQVILFHLGKSVTEYAEKWQDAGSSAFASGLLEKHEKMAWMLNAHLIH